MKRCPECRRDYYDDTLLYCLDDGNALLDGPASGSRVADEPETALLPGIASPESEAATRAHVRSTGYKAVPPSRFDDVPTGKGFDKRLLLIPMALAVIGLAVFFGYQYFSPAKQIESIAVMPFVNDSGNADIEYLSDGMTETLISSLSQLPKLNVKARSSIFRYKGKQTDSATIGRELNVQAILNGRVVQRGQELVLYVELVEAKTENSLWKQTYNRTMTNLVALQYDIARDVADKLKLKLSGVDQQRLAKNYTENVEAYQLYLKGRYHVFKLSPPEVYKGIAYLEQAIEIDPAYALAYVGLSEAHRTLALGVEMNPQETFPKAMQASKKALEIDDSLAEAHGSLAVTLFWYEWDWAGSEAANKRALERNPNSAISQIFYAHLLSNTGRHVEALAAAKRARELDPLSSFVGSLEGQFLLHAGRLDEALARLQQTSDLDPNFFFPHVFTAAIYIEKGMYSEAIVETDRAKKLGSLTMSDALRGYALAKSGREEEARAVIANLIQLSATRFVPPYHIAMIYNGFGDTDESLMWLERGYAARDPKMTFLKVDRKWNNLRGDQRFQDLMKKIGFVD